MKILPPVLFVAFALIVVAVSWLLPELKLIQSPWHLMGVIPFFLGLVLSVSAKNTFIRAETNVDTFCQPDLLVTHGAFSYSRNPMYLGFAFSLLGVVVCFGVNLIGIALWMLFIGLVNECYIRYEEKVMQQVFVDDYTAYCRSVRRWL